MCHQINKIPLKQTRWEQEVESCEPGTYTIDTPLDFEYESELDAISACDDACRENNAEYQSHIGTMISTYYRLLRCTCWCEE